METDSLKNMDDGHGIGIPCLRREVPRGLNETMGSEIDEIIGVQLTDSLSDGVGIRKVEVDKVKPRVAIQMGDVFVVGHTKSAGTAKYYKWYILLKGMGVSKEVIGHERAVLSRNAGDDYYNLIIGKLLCVVNTEYLHKFVTLLLHTYALLFAKLFPFFEPFLFPPLMRL